MNFAVKKKISPEDWPSQTELSVAGESFHCDWEGCLFWPKEGLMVVSDLHFEKGSSFARKGMMVPPYDTGTTLNRLAKRIEYWRPQKLICLGDSFHDEFAHDRIPEIYKAQLTRLMSGLEWMWISGNHDPSPPVELGGICAHEISIGPISFRHEPKKGNQTGEISGHLHPKARIYHRYKSVSRPCFVTDTDRLIMPSFGAYTGGLNVKKPAFDGLFDETRLKAFLLSKERVFEIAGKNLS